MLGVGETEVQWPGARGFADTASYGLPPTCAWDVMQQALSDWRHGRTDWRPWAETTERSRQALARLLAVGSEDVAVGASVSELVALLAAAVPDGSHILTARGDFTSLIFPWTVHSCRGIEVTAVPLGDIAAAIDRRTSVVAVSAVQSSNGQLLDIEALLSSAAAHDVLTVLDVTQSLGWLPCQAARFDAVVGAGYKWLMAPRGVAFIYLAADRWPGLRPLHAGWFAGRDPFDTYYDLPLRLSATARRLDTSPAWFSWVGAAPALELIEGIGIEKIHAHNTGLANRLRTGLGMDTARSAIVPVPTALPLTEPATRAASRNGATRFSFHLYNNEADVDKILAAILDDARS